MKYRVLQISCAVLATSVAPSLFAVLPPRHQALPNYDIRENAVSAAALSTPKAPEQTQMEVLRARLPKIQVSRDPIVNTPRHISVRTGFLSGPGGQGGAISSTSLDAISANDPHRTVKAFLNEQAAVLGHDASVLQSAKVERNSVGSRNGLRTTVWQQTHRDIPVFGGRFISHVTADGELVSVSDQFVSN